MQLPRYYSSIFTSIRIENCYIELLLFLALARVVLHFVNKFSIRTQILSVFLKIIFISKLTESRIGGTEIEFLLREKASPAAEFSFEISIDMNSRCFAEGLIFFGLMFRLLVISE